MEVKVLGRVRKILEGIDSEAPGNDTTQFAVTPQLEQLVANGSAPYREIVRMGRAFQVTTTTAVAAVVAMPSTTGGLSLYNNESDGGRSYIIDFCGAVQIASAAAAGQGTLIALIGQVRETAPTTSALVPKKLNGLGGGTNDTRARTILTGTALPANTGIAADWFPVGAGYSRAGVTSIPGAGAYWETNGRIIVPPGRYFSIHLLADTAATTAQFVIGWHEAQLLLG